LPCLGPHPIHTRLGNRPAGSHRNVQGGGSTRPRIWGSEVRIHPGAPLNQWFRIILRFWPKDVSAVCPQSQWRPTRAALRLGDVFYLAVRKHAGLRTRDTISASRLAEAFGITTRSVYEEFVVRRVVAAAYSADAVPTTKSAASVIAQARRWRACQRFRRCGEIANGDVQKHCGCPIGRTQTTNGCVSKRSNSTISPLFTSIQSFPSMISTARETSPFCISSNQS